MSYLHLEHLGTGPADVLPSPYRDESQVVQATLEKLHDLQWDKVLEQAVPWVEAIRKTPAPFWAMERLLQEYPISSDEGLALMRLAECLLRVPDTETAIAFTADQLSRAEFDDKKDGALGRLSNLALGFSKHFLPDPEADKSSITARLGGKAVVAATLRAVQLLGQQFVLGQTIELALKEAHAMRKDYPQYRFSFDMLGEGARTMEDAGRYLAAYQHAIDHISRTSHAQASPQEQDGISIKLSALHPRYEAAQISRLETELVPELKKLIDKAAAANINLTIDAEEVDRLELSLALLEPLFAHIAATAPQWRGFGLAMQAYQTRALDLVNHVIARAQAHGIQLMCRLVKGAYWDSEIKRAQELGLAHYPVFTHKHHSDMSYLACARALLQARPTIYPQFATHNAATIAAVLELTKLEGAEIGKDFEFQKLFGMGNGVYREVLNAVQAPCRIYAPVGTHKDLLAYLVRRLLENGANSSFVHKLGDPAVPITDLLKSPLYSSPKQWLALPAAIYSDQSPGAKRVNSAGLDLAEAYVRQTLNQVYAQTAIETVPVSSTIASDPQFTHAQTRGMVAQVAWNAKDVSDRAQILRSVADDMQSELGYWCTLLVKEAHKNWADAIAEVREAIDFLRYYADEAERIMPEQLLPGPTGERNTLSLKGRGVWVCISPWNFPLAIFLGQVSAALVTGNAVLAKPAEQTPYVAFQAVALLHKHGVPQDVLQIFHGTGETVGAGLVQLTRIAGVVFTGSTQVAKLIQRNLAAKDCPIIPLIAETGGLNAMLVDSTALPEQVCDAVVQSSFRSAGQRCSALRVLCLHESIYEAQLEMLHGAVRELSVNEGQLLATDVGPVIDKEAYERICQQIRSIDPALQDYGYEKDGLYYIKPLILERAQLSDIDGEIFGPVLQVVKWSGKPQDTIDAINQLGYGLTMGIHTRIDSRALRLAKAAHIGNVYINRNMIGAVVGVQPFGGEGLSGTGPKAGGPHYLYRFCAEQTITVNTAAAGGNAQLMTQVG